MATSDIFPMTVSPIQEWVDYAATHPALPGLHSAYPAIDGDELALDFQGSLPRTSVVGETTLWEKVSA
jgi:hypothetical protein